MSKFLCVLGLSLCFCAFSNASSYEQGTFQVSKLVFSNIGVYVAFSPAPAACGGGTRYRMHFKLDTSDPTFYKDMVAGLLAAHASNQTIQYLFYDGTGPCSNNNVLSLYSFEFTAK